MDANVNQVNSNGWHSLLFAVIGGQIDVVDYLIYETNVDVQLKDNSLKNGLDYAEYQNDLDIVNLFLEFQQS